MFQVLRPMRPRDPAEHHRVSTTLELFFDLITVLAIAAVTAGLHHAISEGHGLDALPRFVFLFVAVWWAWMNYTWFASAFDNDDAVYRLLTMVIMAGAAIFAGGAEHIFATLDFSYGLLGWIVMRLGMIGLWLRAASGAAEYRTTCRRYALGIFIAQLGWCALYFGVTPATPLFFLCGALVWALELAVPPFAESARITPFHRHHMIERYGLLMIISLGEIVLSVSHGYSALFGDHPVAAAALVATSALVIVFAIWWVYFAEEEHLASARLPVALLWGYGHVLIFGATAALGAAVAASVDVATHHAHAVQAQVSPWLGGSLALLCLALWVARDLQHALPLRLRLALPVMAVLFLAAGLAGLPVWVFAVLAVAMVLWRAVPLASAAAAKDAD